jgi:hypothetical protein
VNRIKSISIERPETPCTMHAEEYFLKLRYGIGLLAAIELTMSGQTQLDLKTQSRNVDFSQAVSVRPFPTGIILPNTCKTGEMFFKSNAPAGANLYGCVAANVWAAMPQGTGGGGNGAPAATPFDFQASGSLLSIGTTCTLSSACRVMMGSTLYSYPAPATATANRGSGTAYVYVDVLGSLTVGYGGGAAQNDITCAGCTAVFNITAFPDNAFPIVKATWTNGIWDPNGNTDERAPYSAPLNLQAGPNVIITPAAGGVQISASTLGTSTASGYATIQNAGNPIFQQTAVNFTGAGIACSDDPANLRTNCNVPGGGSGGSSSDASDVTAFDNTFYMNTLGYSNGPGLFWGFTGSCSGVYNLNNLSAGEIALSFWNTNANSTCTLFAPSSGGVPSGAIVDFISGSSPLPYKHEIQYARNTSGGDGDHYIGFSQAPGGGPATFDNFVGIRGNSGGGQWQCVIRSNGADIVSTNIMPVDTSVHWFRIHNGSGAANSVTCQIGSTTATVSGTIPPGNWFAIAGAISASSSQPRFFAGEVRLHISSRTGN